MSSFQHLPRQHPADRRSQVHTSPTDRPTKRKKKERHRSEQGALAMIVVTISQNLSPIRPWAHGRKTRHAHRAFPTGPTHQTILYFFPFRFSLSLRMRLDSHIPPCQAPHHAHLAGPRGAGWQDREEKTQKNQPGVLPAKHPTPAQAACCALACPYPAPVLAAAPNPLAKGWRTSLGWPVASDSRSLRGIINFAWGGTAGWAVRVGRVVT